MNNEMIKNKSQEMMDKYSEIALMCFKGWYESIIRKEHKEFKDEFIDNYVNSLFTMHDGLFLDEKVRLSYATYISGFVTAKMLDDTEIFE